MSAPAAVQFSSSRYLAMSTADAFEASHKIAPRSAPQVIRIASISSNYMGNIQLFSSVHVHVDLTPYSLMQKCVNFDRKSVHQFPMHVRDQSHAHPYGVSAHQVNEARNFPLASRHPVPVSTSSNFLKLHDSQSIPAIPLMPKALRVGETVVNTSDYASNFGGAHRWNFKLQIHGNCIFCFQNHFRSLLNCLLDLYRSMHSTAPMTAQLTIFYAGVVNVYDDVPLEKVLAYNTC